MWLEWSKMKREKKGKGLALGFYFESHGKPLEGAEQVGDVF